MNAHTWMPVQYKTYSKMAAENEARVGQLIIIVHKHMKKIILHHFRPQISSLLKIFCSGDTDIG